jgi:predicted anti-sigma-YlaC factor YlaD
MMCRQNFLWSAFRYTRRLLIPIFIMVALMNTGCSMKRMAVNTIGDALSGGGTSFAMDNDPELIKSAVPFSLKLMESLLAESPSHKGLLLACASGFTQYSFAFVAVEADETEVNDLAGATKMRLRARHLYLRARDYGLRGLEVDYPNFGKALRTSPGMAVQSIKVKDVPLIYWTAVSWAGAISILKDDADLIADLPIVEALIDRALELDEKYDNGAIHAFLIAYEMNRQTGSGDPEGRARGHFKRAVELSEGRLCGPFITLAESVSLPNQDKTEFQALLQQVLDIKSDNRPELSLANLVMQRRARWLLGRIEQLFVE